MRLLLTTFALGALLSTSAMAGPSMSKGLSRALAGTADTNTLVQIQHRRDTRRDRRKRRPNYRRHRFAPGSRHRAAPRGWRRHHKRPYNWRTRGCIIVGPVWFCP
jgi:Ni/Co efflux regulator RcnB